MARAVTTATLLERKQRGEKITMLTAYDFPSAQLLEESTLDAILVGDSMGMALMGRPSTLSVTVDEIVHHTAMVARGLTRPLLVADMPFMSYQVSEEEAVRNAGRLVAEGGAQAVKLEGGAEKFGAAIARILNAGIPVMGHIGLTPQSVNVFGGYKVQGRDPEARERLKREALGLQEAGCFSIVLECVPADLAAEITQSLTIPTIGIGAGKDTDGQVLVWHDIFGWGKPRFTKTFADVRGLMKQGIDAYIEEVKSGTFPAEEHTY
jgi:3-methyl-2-oxobutanoate hydroxymethyltransferase